MAKIEEVSEIRVIVGDKCAVIQPDDMVVENHRYVEGIWRVDIHEWLSFYGKIGKLIDYETGFHSWQEAMQSAIEHM